MALDPTPVGTAIAAAIKSLRPTPGTVITDTELTNMWIAVMTQIYNDLKANLQVDAGGFTIQAPDIIAPSGGGPCSGNGVVIGIGGPAL
jgi:hypothetical protein